MIKKLLVFSFVILVSCQKQVKPEEVVKINGYWEIESVDLPDGVEKLYNVNPTIDYFEIQNDSGFRKKVMPQLDGKYVVNDQKEDIKVIYDEERIFIAYKTSYSEWKEEVLEISDENLVLKNAANIEYNYKRPTPFSIK